MRKAIFPFFIIENFQFERPAIQKKILRWSIHFVSDAGVRKIVWEPLTPVCVT